MMWLTDVRKGERNDDRRSDEVDGKGRKEI
jgi:hypothetical protein